MAAWNKIRFYHDTMLGSTGSTLTATDEATGYEVANIHNMLEVNKWKAASGTSLPIYINYDNASGAGHTGEADYLVILGHNLNSINAKITLQYSTDNFAADINDAFTGEKPASDNVYLKEFTNPGLKRYWRLKIEENTGGGSLSPVPYMDICIWGLKTELDYASASFDPHSQDTKANVNLSAGGYVTGIHERYTERRMELNFNDADAALYAKVNAWWEGSGAQQFFVAYDTANSPNDVWLMLPEGPYDNPLTNGGNYRDITINLKGRKA